MTVAAVAIIATVTACTAATNQAATNQAATSQATSQASSPGRSEPPASASASPTALAPPAVPTLDWTACPPAADGGASTAPFQCATAAVPVDYADPSGPTFELAVIKYPAVDLSTKLGTVFWNPGGPSDSGTEYLPVAAAGFPAQVHQRFDIISWDPRGMGGHTTPVVQCLDNADDEAQFLAGALGSISLPVSDAEMATFTTAAAGFNQACVRRNGDLLAHLSTADNARDLDLLRQAVGEDTLNYYGTSYGTFLGATYLNMFPDRVRAAVLDGAVAPKAWAGSAGEDLSLSTFLRIGSDLGGTTTLDEVIRRCGAVDTTACAFSAGSPEATTDKFATLLDRAKAGLVVDGQLLDDRALLATVQSQIYIIEPVPGFGRFPGYAAVAQFLQEAWQASEQPAATSPAASPVPSSPAASPAPSSPATSGAAGAQTYVTSGGRQRAVICGESPNPTSVDAIAAQARVSYQRAGLNAWPFGAMCQDWIVRAADSYLGPWDTPTKARVLVIGNVYDPATPYSSSQAMAAELANAQLLTVNGFGHTVLLNPSTCAQDYIAAYYLDGSLPPADARCDQDQPPFGS